MPESVRDHKNSGKNCATNTNINSQVQKKLKLKMKAAKVLKFLLNFLPVKSKKSANMEKLFMYNHLPNSYANDTSEIHPMLEKLSENIPSNNQMDKGLSSSWSYLVHEPFSSKLDSSEMNISSSDIYYNESYFEDDYWLDYREQEISIESPVFGNESLGILFELERTPCGEFKRVVSDKTPQRRHSSLPDLAVKDDLLEAELQNGESCDRFDFSEELLDYNKYIYNRSQFGLQIAFDNHFGETVWNSKLGCNTTSELQSISMVGANKYSIEHITAHDHVDKNQEYEETNPLKFKTVTTFHASKPESKTTLETFNHSAGISGQVFEIFSASSDQSVLKSSSVKNIIAKPPKPVKHSNVNAFVQTSQQMESELSNAEHGREYSNRIAKRFCKQRSLESGYNSFESVSLSAEMSPIPHQIQGEINTMFTQKHRELNPHTESVNHLLNCSMNSQTNTRQTPALKLSVGNLKPSNIDSIKTPITSSPMYLTNTLASRKHFALIPDFLSPIGQHSEILKSKLRTHNYLTCFKPNRLDKSHHEMNVSLQSKLNHVRHRVKVIKPSIDDYNLLSKAADFILNRVGFKEELKSYISSSDVVGHLSSYFMLEIFKLSNKFVQSVTDYKKAIQESGDLFHSDKLTYKNCFCELLKAILSDKPEIVSKCETYIFENLHDIIYKQNEAAPELIFLLLCNICILRLNTFKCQGPVSEIKSMRNYLEAHQKNFESYIRMKKIFSILFQQADMTNMGQAESQRLNAKSELQEKLKTKDITSLQRISSNQLGVLSGSPVPFSLASKVSQSGGNSCQASSLQQQKMTYFWQQRQQNPNWNRMGPVISTMV